MSRKTCAAVVVAVALALVAGCGGKTPTASPTPAATPTINPDGQYLAGTLPDADAAAAVKAAVEAIPVALSWDYRSLDTSLGKATALMTTDFVPKFTQVFKTTTVPTATAKKSIVSALVRAAGAIGQVKDGSITCLVYVDQLLVSSKTKDVTPSSVDVVMHQVDGKWLIDDIEPVQSP